MSASDIMLWVTVAVVAFLVGQNRTGAAQVRNFWRTPHAYEGDDAEAILTAYRRWLLRFIERSYSLEELRTLAFDLGIGWDRIGGNTIDERGREMIIYCERNGMIGQMLDAFKVYRR